MQAHQQARPAAALERQVGPREPVVTVHDVGLLAASSATQARHGPGIGRWRRPRPCAGREEAVDALRRRPDAVDAHARVLLGRRQPFGAERHDAHVVPGAHELARQAADEHLHSTEERRVEVGDHEDLHQAPPSGCRPQPPAATWRRSRRTAFTLAAIELVGGVVQPARVEAEQRLVGREPSGARAPGAAASGVGRGARRCAMAVTAARARARRRGRRRRPARTRGLSGAARPRTRLPVDDPEAARRRGRWTS